MSYKNLEYHLILRHAKNVLERRQELYSDSLPLKDKYEFKIKDELNTKINKVLSSKNKEKKQQEKKSVPEKPKQVIDTSKFTDIPEELHELKKEVITCVQCGLHETRNNVVFGTGTGKSKLVVVGEAPGADEDKTGFPFVGRAGQLLTKMLKAIDIEREDVFICNVLKCRPPQNRDPRPDEIRACSHYLDKQLEILKPKYILALGRIAAKRLLNVDLKMKDFRTTTHSYNGIPLLVTYHPAALLRNPNWKREAWVDLQNLQKLLNS